MTDDLFNALALRVLAKEASPEEKKALDQFLASEPAKFRDFEELAEIVTILKTSGPLAQAGESRIPPLPAYRMQELRSALRKEFPAKAQSSKTFSWRALGGSIGLRYAACALAVLFMAGMLLNLRSGIEFGTYQDSTMRDAAPPVKMEGVSVQSFSNDRSFQNWQESRFGPRFRLWFDEAQDRIVVVESGGLFSKNKTSSYPLPDRTADRERAVREIIQKLESVNE